MKFHHMMNGEVGSFQVGRRLCTYLTVWSSWVPIARSVANWIEFLTPGVPTKQGSRKGADQVWKQHLVLDSLCVYRVYRSHLDAYGLNLAFVLANYTRMFFLVTLGGGNWHAESITLGHWARILADEGLVKRGADPRSQEGQHLLVSCLGHLVRMRAICFEQSHRLTTVDDNTKAELDECLSFFRAVENL